jgi:hypothetical protein
MLAHHKWRLTNHFSSENPELGPICAVIHLSTQYTYVLIFEYQETTMPTSQRSKAFSAWEMTTLSLIETHADSANANSAERFQLRLH